MVIDREVVKKPKLHPVTAKLQQQLQKLALIFGPPGLLKTTLAHSIARHESCEQSLIIASDDCTPVTYRLVLGNRSHMQNVFAGHLRPKCIVLDGVQRASIEFWPRFTAGQMKEREPAGKKGKGSDIILRRPIICICNDLYKLKACR